MSSDDIFKDVSDVPMQEPSDLQEEHLSSQQIQDSNNRNNTSPGKISQIQERREDEDEEEGEEEEEELPQNDTRVPQQPQLQSQPQLQPQQHVSSGQNMSDSESPKQHLQEPVVLTHGTSVPSALSMQTRNSYDYHQRPVQAPYINGNGGGGGGIRTAVSDKQLPRLDTSFSQTETPNSGSGSGGDSSNGLMTPRNSRSADRKNPLVVLMPASAQPTEVLANRFSAWRGVIRSVITYLTETASIQDEVVRQQLRLTHAVQFPFFVADGHKPNTNEEKTAQSFFMPAGSGSIQELPSILNRYHGTIASHASKMSKELTNEIIPRLEDLRRDLLVKIKEIKSLQSDFKNSCFKELQQTKFDMKRYFEAIEEAHRGSPKHDPYLAKIILDRQIRKQLSEENFVHEAFDNLESSGSELENVVVMEIQNSLTIYARLLGEESQLVFDILLSRLDNGFLSRDPAFEWNSFIERDPNFIAPNLPMRKLKEISYKHQYDPLSYEIRSGPLERRSKFLKSYSKGYYVLTPNFLHEFKTSDRKKDQIPMMSLPLGECTVTEHSRPGSSDDKFILHAKQNGIIHRGHNWVFRTENFESMLAWFEDLKVLTSMSSLKEKNSFIQERLNLTSDGRPKQMSTLSSPNPGLFRNSTDRSLRSHLNGSATSCSGGTPSKPVQNDLNGNSPATRSDNQTNAARTSSVSDTNRLDVSNNLYA